MRILAIDPGPKESAWLIYDTEKKRPDGFSISSNNDVKLLVAGVRNVDEIAIEMIAGYGMSVGQEVFETCVWIGRFREHAKVPIRRITRKQVKLNICGNISAKDKDIRAALIDRFGEPGKKANPGVTYGMSGDVWAACAVGVTAAEIEREVWA